MSMELGSRGVNTEATINNNTAATSSSSGGSNMNTPNKNLNLAHYGADARLLSEFEQSVGSGKSFNYSTLLKHEPKAVDEQKMTAYLERIQRGGFVQPFGCMIAIEEPTFRIISFSENCFSMLSLNLGKPDDLIEPNKSLIGIDARILFTSSSRASLERAVASREITLLNPIWVHSRSTRKPFYAILHRIDVGVVIDLEPANSGDPTSLLAGAVQSQKLVVRAISRLQSLPGGDIGVLCDTVVEEVQKLTGYDRVMVYKFHDDEHGEVVSEIRRSDLEPYLGVHYPATDIPQAARFLFKQNRVRIIVDCHAESVEVIQSEELNQPLCLVNSTLRAPHGCHKIYMSNMNSIGTLVMAILVNNNDSMKLWGLVACHHTTRRYIHFPLRYACEFLMQSMGLQLYMELQLAKQKAEKKILRMQTTLCDMLLRDAPFRIITQSPSIMDLIKCDGAALYYGGKVWLVGITPNEQEVMDIANWLCSEHKDSTGFSTESLLKAGYPGAVSLGDAVCGMAAAQITSKDFLFWFRSHTEKEIKWAGDKHHPKDEDDGERMHPRSSFKAFLEVAKKKSLSWEDSEINVIHSLQLIMRTSAQDVAENGGGGGGSKVMKYGQQSETGLQGMDEISSIACEMVRLIETTSVPIFGVDASGLINGWNAKIAELTGLAASEAMGKSLIDEVIHESSRVVVEGLLCRALQGAEEKDVELKLRKVDMHQQNNTIIYIMANTCTSRDYKNNVVGVCFVGQDVTTEKIVMDKFIRMEGDYKTIIQSPHPLIPPLFSSDENACCSEWNAAMEELTGHMRREVLGKVLPGEVFGGLCKLKDEDTLTKFMILLYREIKGHDTSDLPFGFFNKDGNLVEVKLTANKRVIEGGKVVGCFCFLQTSAQWPLGDGKNQDFVLKSNELAYLKQEIKNPLNGLRFAHELLENTAISYDQKQYLETSGACERQIASIVENMDIKSIEDGVELNLDQFALENLLDAIVSQVMIVLKEKNIPLVHEIPDQLKTLTLLGDQIRLQIVLSDFLLSIVHHAPSPDGWVEIKVAPGLRMIQDGHEFIHLQFRMSHPGPGLPVDIIRDMYEERKQWDTQEGLALNLSRKLLGIMKGHVNYVRDDNGCIESAAITTSVSLYIFSCPKESCTFLMATLMLFKHKSYFNFITNLLLALFNL
ncbi:phytochrome E-like isoform X2 [Cynara cardunculus var. scolymus]|uniref:phytochrome E-like isoform X2 n=1 Tax=Cynara cardunculus var. scolymus TaxID=59895 RepID=UPI000D62E389|nr:phytochrome E-like isoform X2 [Cynara cardunculus var. scolymus]